MLRKDRADIGHTTCLTITNEEQDRLWRKRVAVTVAVAPAGEVTSYDSTSAVLQTAGRIAREENSLWRFPEAHRLERQTANSPAAQ